MTSTKCLPCSTRLGTFECNKDSICRVGTIELPHTMANTAVSFAITERSANFLTLLFTAYGTMGQTRELYRLEDIPFLNQWPGVHPLQAQSRGHRERGDDVQRCVFYKDSPTSYTCIHLELQTSYISVLYEPVST